jgi:uncharacterized protein (DUF305 family)
MATTRRLVPAVVALTLGALLMLTGCAGESGDGGATGRGGVSASTTAEAAPTTPDKGAPNSADIAFANDIIVHHGQSLQMASLAATMASNKQIKELAAQLTKEQNSQVKQMRKWLNEWDQPLPSSVAAAPASGQVNSGLPGMMDAEDMQTLATAPGPAFDRRFLEMMIEHHDGAVQLAEEVIAEGGYLPVRELAESIRDTQMVEIEEMRVMLGIA